MHALLEQVDSRLRSALDAEFTRRTNEALDGIPRGTTVVLVGQRAAGKSTLLSPIARALHRSGVDLDLELERRRGEPIREWFARDERGFRDAERETFLTLPKGIVVAAGGGFLSHHAEALRGALAVEIPISFDTYSERLRADPSRPRLRPELLLSEELREVFTERERLHAAARPMGFVEFLLRLERGMRSRRVVTLPPGEPIEPFAWKAKHDGADLLEIRTDLHPPQLDLLAASRALPLLVAERGERIPSSWLSRATLVDRESAGAGVISFHAEHPLATSEAVARWQAIDTADAQIKHVEPLGVPSSFARLMDTQERLIARFGPDRVTVLATGPLALPFRAVLNQRNALDYLALTAQWRAAAGQRQLGDAVREARYAKSGTPRLGILGTTIAHSRSPRVHVQPFDRIELPADVELDALLDVLRSHYSGFAVTNPFKKRVARSGFSAVNTLIRSDDGWRGENSDVEGARATWEALGKPERFTVLGDGGVTEAFRLAALKFEVVTRANCSAAISGFAVWTWPAEVAAPDALRFDGATVAIVSYGAAARRIEREIVSRGGKAVRLGARWFIAQARRQRALWR